MKILAIGEVMMRLTPPNYKLIEQTTTVDLSFSGTGLNILSGLSRNNVQTSLLTGLPNNAVGKAAASFIRKLGVNDQWLHFSGNHIGTYFLELGYGNRASQVTYLNREASSFCQEEIPRELLRESILNHDLIHVCGIALSTSSVSRELILETVKIASELNKKIIFDFNYRPSLNQDTDHNRLLNDYKYILSHSFMVFGSPRDISNVFELDNQTSEELVAKLFEEFPSIEWFSGTVRGENDTLQGAIYQKDTKVISQVKELTIYDRIGTGDAYAAGILLGFINNWSLQDTVEFAISCAELSHTTFGDSPVLDESFVRLYMKDPSAKVYR